MDRLLHRVAARAKARLPEDALRRAVQARSLLGDGPAVAPLRADRVLVLAPHPDDETIGAGGTATLAIEAAAAVTVAIATDGDASVGSDLTQQQLGARRREDAEAAARILGISDVRFLGHRDGHLASDLPGLVGDLHDLLEELDPEVVILPWWGDGHADHRALNDALVTVGCDEREVWGSEVWTPAPVNRLVDISAVAERKAEALAAHATASDAFDVTATLGLNRYRSIHGLLGAGYAEGFVALHGDRYASAVRRAAG